MAQSVGKPPVDVEGNNLDSVTPIAPPIESMPRLSSVLRAGVVTGITASLVCWLLYGIASLFGTDFDVRMGFGDGLTHVAWYQILMVPLLSGVVFAGMAAGLRRHPNCRRNALLIGYALGAVSLLAVVLQPAEVTWPTKIWLAIFHIVTIVLVVPQVARVIGDADPYVTAGYRRSGLDAN
jgi:hypothetical protein